MHQGHEGDLVQLQCGREISREEIEEIRETVGVFQQLSREEPAVTICEHLEWFSASGSPKSDACLNLLLKLEPEGLLKLPAKKTSLRKAPGKPYPTQRTEPVSPIEGSLTDIGRVRLEMVGGREETQPWNEYVHRYHYLGYKQPFGCFARYFVESDHGKLGYLLFFGAAKALRQRDRWIGWSESSRLRNLGQVVNNSRFVIFPWAKVKNLASHVLGQAVRRIRDDWEQRWSYRPVLLETFVDPMYFEGTCYRASNRQYLGMTTGEGLVRKGKSYTTSPRKIFVKPLADDFRTVLCS
ncbi:MAG: Druantia anti-phage system protein DruA [Syntrophobacteraceae bacterium]